MTTVPQRIKFNSPKKLDAYEDDYVLMTDLDNPEASVIDAWFSGQVYILQEPDTLILNLHGGKLESLQYNATLAIWTAKLADSQFTMACSGKDPQCAIDNWFTAKANYYSATTYHEKKLAERQAALAAFLEGNIDLISEITATITETTDAETNTNTTTTS